MAASSSTDIPEATAADVAGHEEYEGGDLDLGRLAHVPLFSEPSDNGLTGDGSKDAGTRKRPLITPEVLGVKRFKAEDEDLEDVLRYFKALAPRVAKRERENNRAFNLDQYPEWRLQPLPPKGTAGALSAASAQRKLRGSAETGLSQLLSCNDEKLAKEGAVFISYERMHRAANEKVDFTTLGQHGSQSNWRFQTSEAFLVQTNRETATLDYARRNAKELLSMVPANGGSYRLTPMQRIATALMLDNTDTEIYVNYRRKGCSETDYGACAAYRLGPSDNLQLIINNLPVAAGKTWETIFATMSRLATPEAWNASLGRFEWRRTIGEPQPSLGLTKLSPKAKQLSLARVVIALVPQPVMEQWTNASIKLAETYGQHKWVTWIGTSPLTRGKAGKPGIKRVLTEAIKLTQENNCALFWVMEACTKSSVAATRDNAAYAIPYRIIDEGTGAKGTEPRNPNPESPCLKTIICNATFDQLTKHTDYQPNHPLRRALNGANLSLKYADHCAIMSMCTVPSWLRLAVSHSLAPMMPQGILKIVMRVRVTSLGARLNKTDMIISSTDELIDNMILNTCKSNMTKEETSALGDKCRAILYRTDASESIAQSLKNAIEAVKTDRAGLPKPVPIMESHMSEADLEEARAFNADIHRQSSAYATMERVFTRLSEAICVDPPPECPVTMDAIKPENVCVLRCCGVYVDRTILDSLGNKCPTCRETINGVVSAAQAAETVAKATGKQPANQEAESKAAGSSSDASAPLNSSDELIAEFRRTSGERCSSSLDAVTKSIKLALRFKPKGMRILLCCNVSYGGVHTGNLARDEAMNTARTCAFIQKAVPELTSCSAIGKGSGLGAYKNEDAFNRLLIVDTGTRSTTMAGLNLQMTDLVLFDRLDANISTDKMVQSIGRAMRAMPKNQARAESDMRYYRKHNHSRYAPKLVVFIERFQQNPKPAGAARPAAAPDPELPSTSDDSDVEE